MTATLKELDLYIMSRETAAKVASCRKRLADPLGYITPPDDPESIVQVQLLPENTRDQKYYVYAHTDSSSPAEKKKRYPAISSHLQYRARPSGALPRDMNALRKKGFTVDWLEKELRELQDAWLVFVDAELAIPREDRVAGQGQGPRITVGSSTLRRRGEEYRAEKDGPGDVTKYRWVEDESGGRSVWLSYTHTDDFDGPFWKREEDRCREYLQVLL